MAERRNVERMLIEVYDIRNQLEPSVQQLSCQDIGAILITQKHISQLTKHKKTCVSAKNVQPIVNQWVISPKNLTQRHNLFDLQGWEYILYEVTQNVHLLSTPFLQKAKNEKSCGTFCVLSIPTAENIS
jgi:hypothetical protein